MADVSSSSCRIGSAHGYWRDLDWHLYQTRTCGGQALLPFLRVHESCARIESKEKILLRAPESIAWRRCVQVNASLMHALRRGSILMFGDSTAALLFETGCRTFSYGRRLWRPFPLDYNDTNASSVGRYDSTASVASDKTDLAPTWHHAKANTRHLCELSRPTDPASGPFGPAVGIFSHFGAAGPPYWASAYPPAPYVANTTLGMIEHQLPRFCEGVNASRRGRVRLGCQEPSLIVANSGLWDLEAWWLHDGGRNGSFQLEPSHLKRYIDGVRRMCTALRRRFVHSRIVWRTIHPSNPRRYGSWGSSWGVHPMAIEALNTAVRAFAPEMDLEIVDTGRMLQQLLPRGMLAHAAQHNVVGTWDGRHLYPWVHVPLLNLLLNLLWETMPQEDRDAPGTIYPDPWRGLSARERLDVLTDSATY